jgi:hypothetical protein
MPNSPFTSETQLFISIAPGLSVHQLSDGHVWVVSDQGLFSPIHLGNRVDNPGLASDASLPAMEAVMRLAQIQPELSEALQAIEPDSRIRFAPAPGYKVIASHAETPLSEKGWYVEDSFEHYNASEDQPSAWDACVSAVNHHLASEPADDLTLESASQKSLMSTASCWKMGPR